MRRSPVSRTSALAARSSAVVPPASLARRVAWVVAAGVWLFACVSLASFDASDWPSHAVAVQHDPPANLGGRAGAMLAYQLLLAFGAGVWLLVAGSGAALWIVASGRAVGHPFVRTLGLLLSAVCFGGLHAVLLPQWGALVGVGPGLLGIAAATELATRFAGAMVGLVFAVGLAIGLVTTADALMFALPGAVWRGGAGRGGRRGRCRLGAAFARSLAAAPTAPVSRRTAAACGGWTTDRRRRHLRRRVA